MNRSDRGFATAEAAVVLPVLLLVLGLAVGVLVAVSAQLRCVDAARTTARVAVRGDSDAQARDAGAKVAPSGARIRLQHEGDHVVVLVEARVQAGHWLPAVTVAGRAVAETEATP